MTDKKTSKKYQAKVLREKNTWTAQITRQVSSNKIHVSKMQTDFETQEQAQQWADISLAKFINTQKTANMRQGDVRKQTEETRRQRSARRADKTAVEKLAKDIADNANALNDSAE